MTKKESERKLNLIESIVNPLTMECKKLKQSYIDFEKGKVSELYRIALMVVGIFSSMETNKEEEVTVETFKRVSGNLTKIKTKCYLSHPKDRKKKGVTLYGLWSYLYFLGELPFGFSMAEKYYSNIETLELLVNLKDSDVSARGMSAKEFIAVHHLGSMNIVKNLSSHIEDGRKISTFEIPKTKKVVKGEIPDNETTSETTSETGSETGSETTSENVESENEENQVIELFNDLARVKILYKDSHYKVKNRALTNQRVMNDITIAGIPKLVKTEAASKVFGKTFLIGLIEWANDGVNLLNSFEALNEVIEK